MDYTQFAYWLKGYTEITNNQLPNSTQWAVINDHLKMTLNLPPFDGISGSLLYMTGSYMRVEGLGHNILLC